MNQRIFRIKLLEKIAARIFREGRGTILAHSLDSQLDAIWLLA